MITKKARMEPKPNQFPESIPDDVWNAHEKFFCVPPDQAAEAWKKFLQIHSQYEQDENQKFKKDENGKFILKQQEA